MDNNFYLDEIFFDYVKSRYFRKQLKKYESGSVRKGIKINDLKKISIFEIDLNSQKIYVINRKIILMYIGLIKNKIEFLKFKKNYFLKNMFL